MRLFISYSQKDREFVDILTKELISRNIYIWRDNHEIEASNFLNDKIIAGINNSTHILVVISENYVQSEWCKKELKLALSKMQDENREVIIPILLKNSEIPQDIRDICFIDFRNSFSSGFSKLMDEVNRLSQEKLGRHYDTNITIDWALEWSVEKYFDGTDRLAVYIDSVSYEKNRNYSILSIIKIIADQVATKACLRDLKRNKTVSMINRITKLLLDEVDDCPKKYHIIIGDDKSQYINFNVVNLESDMALLGSARIRRMGEDISKDVEFDYGSIFNAIYKHYSLF